jgi:uncharacterized membrane protein
MAQTATRKRSSSSTRKTNAKKRTSAKSSRNGKGAKSAAAGGAAKATLTTRPGGPVRVKMAGAALKAAAKKTSGRIRQAAKTALPAATDGMRSGLDRAREAGWDRVADGVRKVPVQCSLDVAVPLEAAWDEWMRFDWLPDGAHRVRDVERDGDLLIGRLAGPRIDGDWEAEIVDEREDESLAWQTVNGSDTSGLVTFHRLADRLTRIELQLDVVPQRPGEALALALRLADRRAETVMRSFKAQAEALDPDEYPPVAETEDEAEEADEEQDD